MPKWSDDVPLEAHPEIEGEPTGHARICIDGSVMPDAVTRWWVPESEISRLRTKLEAAKRILIDRAVQQGKVEAERDALWAELEKARRALDEEREMARRLQYPEPFKIGSVYTKRDGITYLLPIVGQWHEYPDVAVEVGWSDVSHWMPMPPGPGG